MSTRRTADWYGPGASKHPQDARGPNGRRLCKWCGEEVLPPRRRYCSAECSDEWLIRRHPGTVRWHLKKRDKGVCARCGLDCLALEKKVRGLSSIDRNRLLDDLGVPYGRRSGRTFWDADHIVPVIEGGGECGLENYRTLCWKCHAHVTAELARRRADQRSGRDKQERLGL